MRRRLIDMLEKAHALLPAKASGSRSSLTAAGAQPSHPQLQQGRHHRVLSLVTRVYAPERLDYLQHRQASSSGSSSIAVPAQVEGVQDSLHHHQQPAHHNGNGAAASSFNGSGSSSDAHSQIPSVGVLPGSGGSSGYSPQYTSLPVAPPQHSGNSRSPRPQRRSHEQNNGRPPPPPTAVSSLIYRALEEPQDLQQRQALMQHLKAQQQPTDSSRVSNGYSSSRSTTGVSWPRWTAHEQVGSRSRPVPRHQQQRQQQQSQPQQQSAYAVTQQFEPQQQHHHQQQSAHAADQQYVHPHSQQQQHHQYGHHYNHHQQQQQQHSVQAEAQQSSTLQHHHQQQHYQHLQQQYQQQPLLITAAQPALLSPPDSPAPTAAAAASPSASDAPSGDILIDPETNTRFITRSSSSDRVKHIPEDVLVIDTPETAAAVVQYIQQIVSDPHHAARRWTDDKGKEQFQDDIYFACDTETARIDVKTQSPVGHGVVICFSIYAGPWLDLSQVITNSSSSSSSSGVSSVSNGQPVVAAAAVDQQQQHVRKNRIWVDLAAGWHQKVLDQRAAAAALEQQRNELDAEEMDAKMVEDYSSDDEDAVDINAGQQNPEVPQQQQQDTPTAAAAAAAEEVSTPKRRRRRTLDSSSESLSDVDDGGDCKDDSSSSSNLGPGSRRRIRRSRSISRRAVSSDGVQDVEEQITSSSSNDSIQSGGHTVAFTAAAIQYQPVQQQLVPGFEQLSDSSSDDSTLSSSAVLPPRRRQRASSSSSTTVTSTTAAASGLAPASTTAAATVYGSSLAAPELDDIINEHNARSILEAFRPFFGDSSIKKVWHNYGFDRHVLEQLYRKLDATTAESRQQQQQQGEELLDDPSSNGSVAAAAASLPFKLAGFGGDTLHMARLWDASRKNKKTYSLASLSEEKKLTDEVAKLVGDKEAKMPKRTMNERFGLYKYKNDNTPGKAVYIPPMHVLQTDEFFRPEWIDYSALDAKATWNLHHALKSQLENMTAYMDEYLCRQLADGAHSSHQEQMQRALNTLMVVNSPDDSLSYSLWDLYSSYWLPFGEVLTDMESEGVRVNRHHLQEQEQQAKKDQELAEQQFRDWAAEYVEGARYMNVNSGDQIRQLLFPDDCSNPVRSFSALNPEYDQSPRPKGVRRHINFNLHGLWGEGRKGRLKADVKTAKGMAAVSGAVLMSLAGKSGAAAKALAEFEANEGEREARDRKLRNDPSSIGAVGSSSSSSSDQSAFDLGDDHDDVVDHDDGDEDVAAAAAANGSSGSSEIVTLDSDDVDPRLDAYYKDIGSQLKLGKMFAAFAVDYGEKAGIKACLALEKLIEVSTIDKLLSAFIQPLQSDNISTTQKPLPSPSSSSSSDGIIDSDSDRTFSNDHSSSDSSSSSTDAIYRVHCSLNLNTETGRLSARRPNLQNQPALEKDRYKVRKAFCAEPGKTLVVADYGQLELRLLAHITNCRSMIEAFELGGDFHSRTALGMYDYIKDDVAAGKCLLEIGDWHGEGDPPPLLKDKYGSERRKAKILNFSIAYGKTAHGLSKDFGVSLEEAQATVNKWYADRPEVLEWQEATKKYAEEKGWVNTMLGRRRDVRSIAGEGKGINSSDKWIKSRAQRASINTPIQGSAADVASAAMLAIVQDKWLRDNGWKLLLQVHDEVMLEGPKDSAEEAKRCVVAAMENPWKNLMGFEGKPLRVDLAVDANIADTWYEAK